KTRIQDVRRREPRSAGLSFVIINGHGSLRDEPREKGALKLRVSPLRKPRRSSARRPMERRFERNHGHSVATAWASTTFLLRATRAHHAIPARTVSESANPCVASSLGKRRPRSFGWEPVCPSHGNSRARSNSSRQLIRPA